jgi:spermidine synthase
MGGRAKRKLKLASMVGLLGACRAQPAALPPRPSNVLFEGDSPYTHVLVTEDAPGVRVLRFAADGARQDVVRVGQPLDLQLPYVQSSMAALALLPEAGPRRVLIIGFGVGAMAGFLRALYPEVIIDGVDIDPTVVDLATRYFGLLPDPRTRVHVMDGAAFLKASEGDYDLIFIDAFAGNRVPRHFLTPAFMEAVKAKLSAGGVSVGNVWGPLSNPDYGAVVAQYRSAFETVCMLPAPGSGNRTFLARRDPAPYPAAALFTEKAAALARAKALPFALEPFVQQGCLAP